VVSKVPDAQVISDLDATVAWAKKSGAGNTAKLGITGFCWGGRIVWLYAAHNPGLKAGVAWYGRLVSPGPADELHPKYPVDIAGGLNAPILGLYGGADNGIKPEHVEQMRQAIKAAGKPSEIIVYPDTPTRSSPTIATATGQSRPPMVGNVCSNGFAATASRSRFIGSAAAR